MGGERILIAVQKKMSLQICFDAFSFLIMCFLFLNSCFFISNYEVGPAAKVVPGHRPGGPTRGRRPATQSADQHATLLISLARQGDKKSTPKGAPKLQNSILSNYRVQIPYPGVKNARKRLSGSLSGI